MRRDQTAGTVRMTDVAETQGQTEDVPTGGLPQIPVRTRAEDQWVGFEDDGRVEHGEEHSGCSPSPEDKDEAENIYESIVLSQI